VTCGIAPDPQGRPFSITFTLPDVHYDIHPELLDTWGDDPFLAIKDVGFYLRVLLPVKLTDGYSVNSAHGSRSILKSSTPAWEQVELPRVQGLCLRRPSGQSPGALEAHAGARHVKAKVLDVAQVPVRRRESGSSGARIITETWPHDEVLLRTPTC